MFKKILIGLAAVVAAFLAFVATRPADFAIQRSATIAASPETVFALVNDFHNWTLWSPWDKRDPGLTRVYEGPSSGSGARYAWVGNKDVGEGRMTIVSSRPAEQVEIKLEFLKPFAATNTTLFNFRPASSGDATQVTWTMSGKNQFVGKAMSVFMDMDQMVGKDFEQGLANMKSVAEAQAPKPAPTAAATPEAPPAEEGAAPAGSTATAPVPAAPDAPPPASGGSGEATKD